MDSREAPSGLVFDCGGGKVRFVDHFMETCEVRSPGGELRHAPRLASSSIFYGKGISMSSSAGAKHIEHGEREVRVGFVDGSWIDG